MYKYYIMGYTRKPEECLLGKASNAVTGIKVGVARGRRVGDIATDDLWMEMHERSSGVIIPDWVRSTARFFFVSAKLKALLERSSGAEIEFIPFKIKNHKGRFVENEVYIANVIGTCDCVDHSNTEGTLSDSTYLTLSKLSLDMGKVPPDSKLFRISSCTRILIVRDDLRAELEKENITGVAFIELGADADIL